MKKPMLEEKAEAALKDAREVFDKYNLLLWLDTGTCLGAVRDKRFIPWDNDIDLSLWKEDAEKLPLSFWEELRDKGFDIIHTKDKLFIQRDDAPIILSMFEKKGELAGRPYVPLGTNPFNRMVRRFWWIFSSAEPVKPQKQKSFDADIILKRIGLGFTRLFSDKMKKRFENFFYKLSLLAGCKDTNFTVPAHYFENLGTIKFYGQEWKLPKDYEGYLTYRYGEGWKTPVKKWDTLKQDGGVRRLENNS